MLLYIYLFRCKKHCI